MSVLVFTVHNFSTGKQSQTLLHSRLEGYRYIQRSLVGIAVSRDFSLGGAGAHGDMRMENDCIPRRRRCHGRVGGDCRSVSFAYDVFSLCCLFSQSFCAQTDKKMEYRCARDDSRLVWCLGEERLVQSVNTILVGIFTVAGNKLASYSDSFGSFRWLVGPGAKLSCLVHSARWFSC